MKEMRRKEKEIVSDAAIEDVVRKSIVCRIALSDEDRPYVVPLCFGYRDNTLYFHSSPKGRKIEILSKNKNVCFEFDVDHEVVQDKEACKWSMKYRSVIGFGKASFVENMEEKKRALNAIMEHYSGMPFDYPESAIQNTMIIKVEIESMTGKQSGHLDS